MKTFIPVSRGWIMKATFSYFPGMFENSAPDVKTSCKLNIIEKKIVVFNKILLIDATDRNKISSDHHR